MNVNVNELSQREYERRLRDPDRWLYDPKLGWLDRRDGEVMALLAYRNTLCAAAKALEAAAWADITRAVEQEAARAGIPARLYWERWVAQHRTEHRTEQPPTAPTKERKTLPLTVIETKAAGSEGVFTGLLAAFGNTDLAGDILSASSCDATLRQLNAAPYSARFLLPLLYQHDRTRPLGGFATLEATSRGLAFKAHINLETTLGRETMSLVRQGALSGMSIGFVAEKSHVGRDGVRVLERITLLEGSVVTLPANPLARITEPLI